MQLLKKMKGIIYNSNKKHPPPTPIFEENNAGVLDNNFKI